MLNKEERLLCSLAGIKQLFEVFEIDTEYLEVTATKNGNEYLIDSLKEIEECVTDYVKNTQPYKFEDLKVGMWVWDNKYDMWNRILEIRINCAKEQEIEFDYSLENDEEIYNDIFEENRFFPRETANVKGVDDNED